MAGCRTYCHEIDNTGFSCGLPGSGVDPGIAGRGLGRRIAHVHARWSHFLHGGALALAVLAFAALCGAADAKKKAKEPPPFTRTEQILQWINEYRHNPEPDRLPDA